MPYRRLKVVYALDAVGDHCAGGLRAGIRVVEKLRAEHDVVLLGTGAQMPGLISLPEVEVPFISKQIAKYQFSFAHPDDAVIARALEGADLLHVQLPFWLGHRALAIARQMNIPVVVSHHVQPENLLYNVGIRWRWLSKLLNRVLVKSFYDRADVVVCPTEFSRAELMRFGLRTPAVVISNGIPERFRPAPRALPQGTFTLLTVGRLAKEKRQELVLEAVRRSKHRDQIRLYVAGRGPLQKRLEQKAVALNGAAAIGYVPDDTLLSLYQRADLYLHASEVELEGLTVLEAERCGCPALIADAPESAARELALGPEWMFAPNDAASLAERIDFWLDRHELLQAAREQTLLRTSRHGLDRTVRQLESIYQWVAAGRPNPLPLVPPLERFA